MLVALVKEELKLDRTLGEILKVLSITLIGKDEIHQEPEGSKHGVRDEHQETLDSGELGGR